MTESVAPVTPVEDEGSGRKTRATSEAQRQTAILDALPAHIAVLDTHGNITMVNSAWRRFAGANALRSPDYGIGLNYLEVCDNGSGSGADEARKMAAGIRSVLAGEASGFSLEYACHSTTEQRWFDASVTPLAYDHTNGAVVMHLNITPRKRGEEDQHAMQQLLDNIVDNIPTAVQLKSVADDFRIRMWNKAAEAMYGLPRSAALGRNVHELWPQADADRMRAADLELVANGSLQDFPDRLVPTINRGMIHAHMRKVALLDAAGNATHLLVIADDITAIKADRARLQESERRFSDLLQNVELAAVMLDREARITYCNEFLLRLTGWRLDEVIGQDWFSVFMPSELGDMKPMFAALLANLPQAWLVENEVLTRSGGHRMIRWNNSVLRSGAGDVIGTASIGEDITEQKRAEEELRRFAQAMDATPDAICLIDRASMRFVHVNDAACRLQEQTREQMLASDPWVVLSTSREELQRVYDAMIASGADPPPLEFPRRLKDGSQIWVELRRHAMRSRDGWTIVALLRDITGRRETEARIAFLNRVHAMLSGINTLIVRVRDRDELFREACRIAVEAGGFRIALIGTLDPASKKMVTGGLWGKDEKLVKAIQDILAASEGAPNTMVAQALKDKRAIVANDSQNDTRVAFRSKHAEFGVHSLAIFPLLVAGRSIGVLALYANEPEFFHQDELKLLTELAGDIGFAIDHIEKQERLDYLAYYDVLTGLANRGLFLERVAQYMRGATRGGHKLALFLIDLERFKNINDSLGQPAGDALLRQVGEWLTRNAGDVNLVSRVGADHFALVMPVVRRNGDVGRLLDKTLQAFLEHPFRLNDAVFRVAVKAGVALFPDDGIDAETLFKNAEAALKTAKGRGERYLFYKQKMTAAVAGKLTLENQLRQALDKGEFILHYQPKVDLASGKLAGAEALIRWNDPRTGLVPPGHFIPVLEETGLIYEVGRWALRQAVLDYLRWRELGLAAVRVAVNVSPLQLRHRGFIGEIEGIVGIGDGAAGGLELEITESLIMEDVRHSIASLRAIRSLGVRVAIDDFGTGFSSLSYLARLPVDTLKIDRSFVVEMTASTQGLALVSTIIDLAHALKLQVVAEGVETEEQSRLLRLLSCDEMQGFLFSKPLPAEIFEARYLAAQGPGTAR